MSHLFRPSLIILAQAVSVTLLLAGCDDLMKQMPAGTGQMIQSGMSVGGAILNRPKFSEADEEKMAQENAKKYEQAHQMWDDPLLDAYLGDIVQRLAAVAHPRPFTYSIRVVKDASINAFTFGGGILYVNAGLLARMDNEGQLAMVLGHEIAHVTESHVVRGIESNYNTQLLGQLAGQAAAAGVCRGVGPSKNPASRSRACPRHQHGRAAGDLAGVVIPTLSAAKGRDRCGRVAARYGG